LDSQDVYTTKDAQPTKISRKEALLAREELQWQALQNHSVGFAIEEWLSTLGGHTCRNYISAFNRLTEIGLVDIHASLQAFSLLNHNTVIDQIKLVENWSEATRQARAAAYIAFTRFLSRRTDGLVKKAEPSREGTSKTFFKVREKVATPSMNRSEWTRFFDALQAQNPRDCLIGKLALQGGKRISEVLGLQAADVIWEDRRIRYRQSKTKGTHKEIWITYPRHVLQELEAYIEDRNGAVFVTRGGRPVQSFQVWRSFVRAGEKAKIPFRVTPHVLRASLVTYLKSQGFSDTDIMAVTGHSSAEMVFAYDKRRQHENASQTISLI
jgi:integrase